MFNYASVREIKALLRTHDIAARKGFGQNFMVHEATRKRFVQLLPNLRGREVWEIGPGIGAISALLLQEGMTLRVFEIDRGFIACLRKLFADEIEAGSFSIVAGDARKTLFQQAERPAAIIGNLPYNIASGLVSRLIARGFANLPMVFTFQKEVVERICARPSERIYGSLSILCQYAMEVKHCGIISPGSFFPVPEVCSAIVKLSPRDSETGQNLEVLERLLGILFGSRRKTIANNVRQSLGPERSEPVLKSIVRAGLDLGLRAERLSVEDFRRMVAILLEDGAISAP